MINSNFSSIPSLLNRVGTKTIFFGTISDPTILGLEAWSSSETRIWTLKMYGWSSYKPFKNSHVHGGGTEVRMSFNHITCRLLFLFLMPTPMREKIFTFARKENSETAALKNVLFDSRKCVARVCGQFYWRQLNCCFLKKKQFCRVSQQNSNV